MNISREEEIAGFSAIKLREFFRRFTSGSVCIDSAVFYLGISPRRAKKLLIQLENEGYLTSKLDRNSKGKSETWWEQTPKGAGLVMASAARPIKRATADRLLSQVLERVEEVNASPDFLFQVTEVILFGSYLDEKRQTLSDLAITLEPKEQDRDKHIKMCRAQANSEIKGYVSFIDRSCYSYGKVFRRLKNRSWGISLHDSDDGILKTGIPTRIVFP